MSKKLDSILAKVPSATVSQTTDALYKQENYDKTMHFGKYARVVAVVPYSLKQEMKMYLACHPEDTEKTLILKALKSCFGFKVANEEIADQRGKGKNKNINL